MSEAMSEHVYMTATQAMAELHVSKVKMAELLRNGTLPFITNPLNRRVKLIPASAVEELKRRWLGRVSDPKGQVGQTMILAS